MFQISTAPVPARMAGTADDYARIGISPREIEPVPGARAAPLSLCRWNGHGPTIVAEIDNW